MWVLEAPGCACPISLSIYPLNGFPKRHHTKPVRETGGGGQGVKAAGQGSVGGVCRRGGRLGS